MVIFGVSLNGYTRGLIKYLEDESKLYQVMFIIDDYLNSSSGVTSLVKDVSENFPSLTMSLVNLQRDLEKHFPPLAQRPRRTTLFVFFLDVNRNDTSAHMTFAISKLEQLSLGLSFPKCLINLFSQTESHIIRKTLQDLWYKNFLDTVILEHMPKNRKLLVKTDSLTIMHEINAFAKIDKFQNVKSQTKWFPNKSLNLHRHRITLLLCTFESTLKDNYYKEIFKFTGLFRSGMNCSIKIIFIHKCKNDVILTNFKREKAEMLLNTVSMKINDNGPNNPKLRILNFHVFKALIPVTRKLTKVLVVSQELICVLVATTMAIVGIRIIVLILKFNSSTWGIFNISQIVMGMSISREPKNLKERIIFGALVLSCIVYSGYLYSVILDITFLAEPQISTIEELANSSLTPIMDPMVKISLMNSWIPHIKTLGMKSIEIPGSGTSFECLTLLANYENVSCITQNAEMFVKIYTTHYRKVNIKLLQEPLTFSIHTFLIRNGSPFLDRFNEIILRASDSGLLQIFVSREIMRPTKILPPEEIGKDKILLIFGYVLVIGYTLGIIAFIVEVVSSISWRRAKFFCVRCFNSIKERLTTRRNL